MLSKALVLLPCLLMAADASDMCASLIQCEQPIRAENVFADTRSMMFKIKDGTILDRICGKVPTLKSCVSTYTGSCTNDHTKRFANFFKDTMNYICTPAGKTVALTAGKTSCTMDAKFDQWFLGMKQTCENNFYTAANAVIKAKGNNLDSSDICPLKATLYSCIKTGMSNKCGGCGWIQCLLPSTVEDTGPVQLRQKDSDSDLLPRVNNK
ncbi:hypothetical protein RRG08_019057 [Elysia crispata]|uniref:Sodefrin-like factor n=1 Tax=Elysia crispata TaxID=231223 RepID=A0AAE1A691_9GAST|nr:hypothetical protein RRG08_019057 [Elysia crispata]